MAPEPKKDDLPEGGYSPHMKTVAWAILVMGISLVLVVVLYIWFGHIGPSFSAGVQQQQQAALRQKYGFPPQQTSSAQLEVPPSLRNIVGTTSTASNSTESNVTTSSGNATASAAGNSTAASPKANQTSTPGLTEVSIIQGASAKTTDAFNPNPVNTKVGNTVTWTNNDSTPHTVVSGSNGKPDGRFDSSPGFKTLITPGQTFSHKFAEVGQYPYFCQLHPNMVGTVNVS